MRNQKTNKMNKLEEKISELEKKIGRSISFLEEHYIHCRESGVDHGVYVVANDIDDNDLCDSLKNTYQEFQRIGESTHAS